MAIEIKFKGYINEIRSVGNSFVYKMSHNQVKKNDRGEWETVGRDYFDVYGPFGFNKGDLVEVVGRLKTREFTRRDGTKGLGLVVNAESITRAGRNANVAAPLQQVVNQATPNVQAMWPEVKLIDDSVPF